MERSLDTTTAFLRRRESLDLEPVKSRDVVLFGPQADLSVARQGAIPRGEQPVAVERNRELVVVGLKFEQMPTVADNVGIRSPYPFFLAVDDPEQVDPLFQRARNDDVVAVDIQKTGGDARGLHRSLHDLESNFYLEVFGGNGCVDREREPILVLVRTDVFYCRPVHGGRI